MEAVGQPPALEPIPSPDAPLGPIVTSTTVGRRARLREVGAGLLRSPVFVVGAVVLLYWVFDAIFWQLYVPQDPQAFSTSLSAPSGAHWFGTDDLGRDVFSRVLAGASSVLTISVEATLLGLIGGIAVGLIAGYYRGIVDDVLMRAVDALLSFPGIIIAILVLTVFGSSTLNVVLVIGIIFSPIVARTVRAAVLVEREREYVAAAKLLGARGPFIMAREILPNITGPIVVEATVRLAYAIFTVATLSFLGFGIQPPSPDWGLTIAQERTVLQIAPWTVLFPALALASLVIAINFVADGLKEVLES
ncbi:MAG TPA: ABC transporter permease [Chloroflexota bacterium]|nr:ABC transporter permease [Chloroflexota bacterium]